MDVGADPEPHPSPERPRLCLVVPCYTVQPLSTGVLGEYVAKVYMETKNRPHSVVQDRARSR